MWSFCTCNKVLRRALLCPTLPSNVNFCTCNKVLTCPTVPYSTICCSQVLATLCTKLGYLNVNCTFFVPNPMYKIPDKWLQATAPTLLMSHDHEISCMHAQERCFKRFSLFAMYIWYIEGLVWAANQLLINQLLINQLLINQLLINQLLINQLLIMLKTREYWYAAVARGSSVLMYRNYDYAQFYACLVCNPHLLLSSPFSTPF